MINRTRGHAPRATARRRPVRETAVRDVSAAETAARTADTSTLTEQEKARLAAEVSRTEDA